MKKCALYTILIAAMLIACTGNSGDTPASTGDTFTETSRQSTFVLDSASENSPKYECSLSIKTITGKDKQREAKINGAILRTIFGDGEMALGAAMDTLLAAISGDYYDLYPEYINEKHINEKAPWFNFTYSLSTNVEYGRKGTIIYEIYNYTHNVGSDPKHTYTYLNFDPVSGEEIHLCDIFKEGCEEYLCNRLTDALADKIGANSRKEIKEKGYLTFNDIYPTENFLLKKDSIQFFYNTYDIATVDQGTTVLGFTYSELAEIMK